MKHLTLFISILLMTVACATVEQKQSIAQPIGARLYSSVGDVMLKVSVQEDLPNAFGRADLYGRKRDRGSIELRFVGLSETGDPVFRRRDVDIQTNETTMTRSGLGTAAVTANQSGNSAVASGIYTNAPDANVEVLPPDVVQFSLNLDESRIITVGDYIIEILEVSQSGVSYIIQERY